jgi:hypothetical protein
VNNCQWRSRNEQAFDFLLFCLCIFGFCRADIQPRSSKVVCTLVDFSLSTATPEVRNTYLKSIRKIFFKMNYGDTLFVNAITDKSVLELEPILEYKFPIFSPTTDNLLGRRNQIKNAKIRLQAIKDSLYNVADSAIAKSNRHIIRTNIMSSLHVAQRIFKKHQCKKILVIFSDMIEDSDSYNFETMQLTPLKIDQIIHQESSNGRLPDLSKVHIYIAGVGVGTASISKEKYFQIKNFWMKYFSACGSGILEENFGSAFLDFNE